jgi:hypothetical protein
MGIGCCVWTYIQVQELFDPGSGNADMARMTKRVDKQAKRLRDPAYPVAPTGKAIHEDLNLRSDQNGHL